MEPTTRSSTVVKCEKHGLHYDSAKTGGCVVCRRESGELPPHRPGAAAAGSGSLPAALAVTGVLVAATTLGMQMLHGTFTTWLRETGNPSAYESGNTYQQQQMDGVLQELKEQGGDDGAPLPEGEGEEED
ncbi:MAG TPA: hypothetical protein DD490_15665 [Acidobacteria bacterium]|nr:hypothetical protein [Acidobacteriota bacterium]